MREQDRRRQEGAKRRKGGRGELTGGGVCSFGHSYPTWWQWRELGATEERDSYLLALLRALLFEQEIQQAEVPCDVNTA